MELSADVVGIGSYRCLGSTGLLGRLGSMGSLGHCNGSCRHFISNG
jgi:hypothetical protein